MNENPEGTPNPLNPNPDLAPEPNQTDELAPEPRPEMSDPVVETLAEPEEVVEEETVAVVEAVETVAPEEPAVVEESVVAPKVNEEKSKKKTWIIVAIVAILVAIGCAVAALLILNPFKKEDAVSVAITKLLNNEGPKNVAAEGTLTLVSDAADAEISVLKVEFDAEMATAHGTSNAVATVALEMADGSEFSFDVEEAMVADGDVYIKIDFGELGEYEEIFSFVEMFEGEWIRVPAGTLEGENSILELEEGTQCLVEASVEENRKELAEIYKANPFIVSSTENINIIAKRDTIYRLGVDEAKFDSFISAAENSNFMKEWESCKDADNNFSIEGLVDSFASAPTVYVEIDENNNFTRIYFDGTFAESGDSVILDTALSYPNTIEIVEPADYTDINTVLMQIFSQFSVQEESSTVDIDK